MSKDSNFTVLASLVAQMVKRLPAMWETQVQSLGWEDPLEKKVATHSSTLAWKIPWTESWTQLSNLTSLQGKGQDYRLQILVLLFMLCDPGQLN